MNARTIRKLREKILSFDEYIVTERGSLFVDDFEDLDRGKRILAGSPEMAFRKYVRWNERMYKEISKFRGLCNTSRILADIRVYNTCTGWKTYYGYL